MDLKDFQANIDKCVEHLKEELSQIHTGRATPELIEGITVEAYGTQSPFKNIASVSASDARSLVIQPWDKTLLEAIVGAVSKSNLGFSASIEGDIVRVKIPDLTEERRKEFVKVMKDKVEEGRVAVRNVRQGFMKEVDEAVSAGLSEDEGDRAREAAEKSVKEANESIESIREAKEKDLMTI